MLFTLVQTPSSYMAQFQHNFFLLPLLLQPKAPPHQRENLLNSTHITALPSTTFTLLPFPFPLTLTGKNKTGQSTSLPESSFLILIPALTSPVSSLQSPVSSLGLGFRSRFGLRRTTPSALVFRRVHRRLRASKKTYTYTCTHRYIT